MAPTTSTGWTPKDLATGAALQTVEALSLGLPLEVWKTRMGRFRTEGNVEAFLNVYRKAGVAGYWAGALPKAIESATKGAVLLFAKSGIDSFLTDAGLSRTPAALLAGAGGGIAQTVVMGPCTFLVTGAVTGTSGVTLKTRIVETYRQKGFSGFYAGGTAVAMRQATNWASREGITVYVRQLIRTTNHGDPNARLSIGEEILAAAVGGTLACWNQPFEVARIEMQARGDVTSGVQQAQQSVVGTMRSIVAERGVKGLFRGVLPRVGLGIYQTFFMVTIARMIKERGWL